MRKTLLIALFTLFLMGCNSSQYNTDLNEATDDMFKNTVEVEEILDRYTTVWEKSIKNKNFFSLADVSEMTGIEEADVEKYFELSHNGMVLSDFSSTVSSLVFYYQETGKLDEIKKQSVSIKEQITELKNPPKEYKEAYDEVLDMYNYSEELIEMALSPDGSLQSFSEQKKQLLSDISSKYKRIEVIAPSED